MVLWLNETRSCSVYTLYLHRLQNCFSADCKIVPNEHVVSKVNSYYYAVLIKAYIDTL